MSVIGKNIKTIRVEKGMTQDQLAAHRLGNFPRIVELGVRDLLCDSVLGERKILFMVPSSFAWNGDGLFIIVSMRETVFFLK